MQEPVIEIIRENPTPEHRKSITDVLHAFNMRTLGLTDDDPDFAVLVRDPESNAIIGGLYALDDYGWAFIKYLVVPEQYRGQGLGARLISAAEEIARSRGYVGVWLDTFEFQARPFYEKMGYEVFGTLEGGPKAIAHYFMRKRF